MSRWFGSVARLAALAALGGAVLVPSDLRAAVECKAELRATPRSDESYDQYVDKVFAVEISSSEACAKVYFDVVTTERLFTGEEITSTRREWRKVAAGRLSAFRYKHRIARDSTLTKSEFKVARCVVCGSESP